MVKTENYDVMRLIEHGGSCYISSEYVEGMTLAGWLAEHPYLRKEECLRLIRDMVRQLELLHRCKGNPCFQYVNPYCIVVTVEEQKLYYLDMNASSNREVIRQMQKRSVREHFLPEEEPYYRSATIAGDIYGLGRTIQYVLQAVRMDPELTRKEEKAFRHITGKCLKYDSPKAYQSVSEIQKNLPQPHTEEPQPAYYQKKMILTALCVIAVTIIATHEVGKITGSLSSRAMATETVGTGVDVSSAAGAGAETEETEAGIEESSAGEDEASAEQDETDANEQDDDLMLEETIEDLEVKADQNRRLLNIHTLYLMIMDEKVSDEEIADQILAYAEADDAFLDSQEYKVLEKTYEIEIEDEEVSMERE